MPFDQGNMTFRICRLPEAMPEDTIERFASAVAQSLDDVTDEPEWGWVSPRHLLDTKITEDTVKVAGFYHLCLRQAVRKIPASLMNAECKIQELGRLAASGAERLGRKERKAIKEEAKQKLLPSMPPQISGTYFVIDNNEKLLFTTAVSQNAFNVFAGLFAKSIGFEPVPLTPDFAASNLYHIDPASIPAFCISPAMDLPDGDGNGALGENFLTWLWFYQEARGGMLPPSKLGEFALMIDGPLTFVAEGAGAYESIVRKGSPTISAEAKAALMVGKKLKSAKLVIARDKNQEWSCMLDANEFTFRGLKLPEGDAMDPITIFEERMTNLFIFHSVFFGLYEKFLKEMGTPDKASEYKAKAREWVKHKEER